MFGFFVFGVFGAEDRTISASNRLTISQQAPVYFGMGGGIQATGLPSPHKFGETNFAIQFKRAAHWIERTNILDAGDHSKTMRDYWQRMTIAPAWP